jgi:hypothetical protein
MIGRRGGFAAALSASAIVSLLLAGTASAFKAPGTSSTGAPTTNTLSVRLTNKHKRVFKTTLLTVADDCAGGFVLTPLPLGRLLAKDFKYSTSGNTASVTYSVTIEGRFITPTQATARIRSSQGNLIPPPGVTPPNICKDDTSFTLFYAGGSKKK